MENIGKEYLNDLLRLKNKVDQSLSDGTLSHENTTFYQALKAFIEIKIDHEDFYARFDQLQDVFSSIALGNFEHKIDIPNQNNLFSLLAFHINTVIEGLDANVKKNAFVQSSIDFFEEPAIITDHKGKILFVNKGVGPLLNSSDENLIDLIIANIFENYTQFGVEGTTPPSEDVLVNIRPLNKSLSPVLMCVREVKENAGNAEGYIYIFKYVDKSASS